MRASSIGTNQTETEVWPEFPTLGDLPFLLHDIWMAYVSGQITEQEYGTAADAVEGWWIDLEGDWTCKDGIWEPPYSGLE